MTHVPCFCCGAAAPPKTSLFGHILNRLKKRRPKNLCCLLHHTQATLANGSLQRGREPPPHGVRILALDGGGTRGLLTIQLLKALEKSTNRRIHELFDLVGGTSTGGILALGLQAGISLDRLENLYMELSSSVFRRKNKPHRYGQLILTGATYKAHVLLSL